MEFFLGNNNSSTPSTKGDIKRIDCLFVCFFFLSFFLFCSSEIDRPREFRKKKKKRERAGCPPPCLFLRCVAAISKGSSKEASMQQQ